jgi:SAM-dependent methyltransferase
VGVSDSFKRMRWANRSPAPEDVLADLIEFHRDHPGITEASIGGATTRDGRSGYDVLADRVPIAARSVLDLGCGNGPLIEALLRRRPTLERIVGVDACAPELERARRRLSDPRVELRAERGQALGIESGSVDMVLSHHAFYLMDPVEPVVTEIARVLRPGGGFAFVTTSQTNARLEPYAELMDRFGALTARDNRHFSGWGDRRVWSREGLERLFFETTRGLLPPLEVEEFAIVFDEPETVLCDRLMRFFYSVELQRRETREELRAAWTEILERTRTLDGLAHFAFPLACVAVRRARPSD